MRVNAYTLDNMDWDPYSFFFSESAGKVSLMVYLPSSNLGRPDKSAELNKQ